MNVVMVDPHDPRVVYAFTAYMTEVLAVCGMNGVSLAHAVSEVADYCPPTGALLAVIDEEAIAACVALRRLDATTGEIKRMWVSPELRGQGVGAALLEAVEARAVELGYDTLRLDTHEGLTAAVAMYTSHGYAEIPNYNDNPDATHFFEKPLRTIQR